MLLENKDKILFIGDSITDCGRSRPIGKDDGFGKGLGDGYVALFQQMLIADFPERKIEVLNLGCNGNRINDLQKRWQRDVLDLEPQHLVVFIGINDVWRQFDRPQDPNQIDIDTYHETYHELLSISQPTLKSTTLISPYMIETDDENPMFNKILDYCEVVEKMARKFDLNHVDLNSEFENYLNYRSIESISHDKIHVNKIGHMIIAKKLYRTLTGKQKNATT